MIAQITGNIIQKDPSSVILEAGGIGYLLKISLHTFSQIEKMENPVKLYTYLQVREDAHTLYGFAGALEKNIFEQLITVSGIGAGTAILLLSGMPPAELHGAIVQENVSLLQSVKGIGKKTAERLIVELRDKWIRTGLSGDGLPTPGSKLPLRVEAVQALVNLGFVRLQAEKSVEAALKNLSGSPVLEDVIRFALKNQ